MKKTDKNGFWRYSFLLPVEASNIISLGEVLTPLISLDNVAKKLSYCINLLIIIFLKLNNLDLLTNFFNRFFIKSI